MSQKYYHNDYKKMMGLDETRTASEKLLDKAIGGFKQKVEIKEERPPEKKVKEEHVALAHREVLEKLMKNIEGNSNAVKVLKPLNILKKCLNDIGFVEDAEVNTLEQWNRIAESLIDMDDRVIGNFSEIGLVIDCLEELFVLLLQPLKKMQAISGSIKKQEKIQEAQVEENKQVDKQEDEKRKQLPSLIEICELHHMFCQLYTDDSFTFNKILNEFKKRYFAHCQAKLSNSSNPNSQIHAYLSRLIMKMFHLPHSKFEWIRQSLAQFFKDYNIQYKQLLSEDQLAKYLKTYNEFINQKSSTKSQMDPANILGNGFKGGKITVVEVVSDGFDKWTTKQ